MKAKNNIEYRTEIINGIRYMECKCCGQMTAVSPDTTAVTCEICVRENFEKDFPFTPKTGYVSTGRPRGWAFMKQYVDKDGNLYDWVLDFLKGLLKEKTTPQGLQAISDEGGKEKISRVDGFDYEELSGFCIVWSYLRLELRLENPHISADELENNLRTQLKKRDERPSKLMGHFIRNYTDAFLLELTQLVGRKEMLDMLGNRISREGRKEINLAVLNIINELISEKQKQEQEDLREAIKIKKGLDSKQAKTVAKAKGTALVVFDYAYAQDFFPRDNYDNVVVNKDLYDFMLQEIKNIGNKGKKMTDLEQKFVSDLVNNEEENIYYFYKSFAPKSLTVKVTDEYGDKITEFDYGAFGNPKNKTSIGKMIKDASKHSDFEDNGINKDLYFDAPYQSYLASINEKKQAIDFIRALRKNEGLLKSFYDVDPEEYPSDSTENIRNAQEFLKRHNFKI